MEKEQWINEVFESTKKSERLEASPFLFEKITNRIEANKEKGQTFSPGIKWAFGLTAVMFIVINILSVTKAAGDKEFIGKAEGAQKVSELNNTVIYNY